MKKLAALALTATFLTSGAALAQDTVVVDLSAISADIASELNIDLNDVPGTVSLSSDAAAEACGLAVGDLQPTCVAVTATQDVLVLIAANDDGDDDQNGKGAENSAREFAPGQQDGDAKDFAPGQQDGDAKDSAPGQLKKD